MNTSIWKYGWLDIGGDDNTYLCTVNIINPISTPNSFCRCKSFVRLFLTR